MRCVSLVGQRFGRLVVDQHNEALWVDCVCDCGNRKRFYKSNVTLGKSKSCGCLSDEVRRAVHSTHGKSKTKEYMVWCRMWSRCTTPSVDRYPRYGGRGIKVCERWRLFEVFLEDMGPLPGPGYSIGRIDNDGNYEPGNCRWETPLQQQTNTSKTVYVELGNGEKKPLTVLAAEAGISADTLRQRVVAGISADQLLQRRRLGERPITVDGRTKLTTEWMREVPIPISSFYLHCRKGLTPEQVVRKYMEKARRTARNP